MFYPGSVFFVLGAVAGGGGRPAARATFPDAWARFHRWCLRVLLGIQVRETGSRPSGAGALRVQARELLRGDRPAGALDYPVPFGKEELYRIPGWGRASRAYGAVTVRARPGRQGAAGDARRGARRSSPAGGRWRSFPKARACRTATRPPLQAGFAGLYKLLGLPVVPVAVNSGPLYQRWWKRPGTITLHFGEPIEPGLPREEIEARVHAAINVLNS